MGNHSDLFRWLAFSFSVLAACTGKAEQWAERIFPESEHDFGTVARGADVVYRFPAKNIYKQDIELASVRSSCGCTSPTIENKLLKTGAVGHIVANFNTRTFTGVHGATLTVTLKWIDEYGTTRTGEAQLRVNGDIRSDVVFEPGAVRFSTVDQGTPAEHRIRVKYHGRRSWQISDVRGKSDNLEVELIQTQRNAGRVEYDLLVRLKDSAAAGDLREQLVLVTNDGHNGRRIPLLVEAKIVPEISLAPQSIVLGDILQGDTVTKKLIVRGKKPFRIVNIDCQDDCFAFRAPDDEDKRHIVELTFTANKGTGKVKQAVNVATDLGENYGATCTVYATVVPGPSKNMQNANSDKAATATHAADSHTAPDASRRNRTARARSAP